jgi:hypothetical protein
LFLGFLTDLSRHKVQTMLMAIHCLSIKNMVMPSRHISPRSFDAILSELGDDPAIPDPNGIRKTSSPKIDRPEHQNQNNGQPKLEDLKKLIPPIQVHKLGGAFALGLCAIAVGIALLMAYESLKRSSEVLAQDSPKEISELKKAFALLRTDLERDQDDLYEVIELIEVSIHSLKENKPISRAVAKPKTHPHESELRRWRYLGVSQMGGAHQGFFQAGRSNAMFETGALVLGDWRLTQLEKDFAAFTHPQGKTIILRPSKSE